HSVPNSSGATYAQKLWPCSSGFSAGSPTSAGTDCPMRKKAVAARTIRMTMPAPSEVPENAMSPGRFFARILSAGADCSGAFSVVLMESFVCVALSGCHAGAPGCASRHLSSRAHGGSGAGGRQRRRYRRVRGPRWRAPRAGGWPAAGGPPRSAGRPPRRARPGAPGPAAVRGDDTGGCGSLGDDRLDRGVDLLAEALRDRRAAGLVGRDLLALLGGDEGEVVLHELRLGGVLVLDAADEVRHERDRVRAVGRRGGVDREDEVLGLTALLELGVLDEL